jgi:hypothetical protein
MCGSATGVSSDNADSTLLHPRRLGDRSRAAQLNSGNRPGQPTTIDRLSLMFTGTASDVV